MENAHGWAATERYFREYLLSTGRSPRTATTYCANLLMFWRACGRWEVTPYQADRQLIRAWASESLKRVSAQRVHNQLAAIRLFYAWLRDIRDRDDDPTAGVTVKRPKILPTKPLSLEEVRRLQGACRDERDRLLIMLLAATGMRISELADLRAEHIDWEQGLIVVHGKGNKERLVRPDPLVLGRLRSFLGFFPAGPIWISRWGRTLSAHQIRKIIYELGTRAQLEGVHPHRLRATFATAYIDQHGDIQALQGMMGHESIETTARYSEYTRLKRGLDQMSSLEFVRALAG